MFVLLDNGAPRGIARQLVGHMVEECRAYGWDRLSNGELLTAAEVTGFDVFITTDKNVRYQQNLVGRKIAVVVLGKARWHLIKPRLAEIAAAVNAATPGSYSEVEIPG